MSQARKKPTKRVGSLVPWFGAKRIMAPQIVDLLGEHVGYYEPFFGSGAVFFAKPRVRFESLNDLNNDLVNVCWTLQDRKLSAKLMWQLHTTICAETIHRRADAIVKQTVPDVEKNGPDWKRAYWCLVYWWLGRSGMAGLENGKSGFCGRFTAGGRSGGVRLRSFVESVPFFTERLASADVLNRCGIEMCEKIKDERGVCLYVDPPYLKKAARYAKDFDEPGDKGGKKAMEKHQRLADALGKFDKARVVVSYYEHPKLRDLYPVDRWAYVKPVANKFSGNATCRKERGKVLAPELLLVNRIGDGDATLFDRAKKSKT